LAAKSAVGLEMCFGARGGEQGGALRQALRERGKAHSRTMR
jgi:hypothetical protein